MGKGGPIPMSIKGLVPGFRPWLASSIPVHGLCTGCARFVYGEIR